MLPCVRSNAPLLPRHGLMLLLLLLLLAKTKAKQIKVEQSTARAAEMGSKMANQQICRRDKRFARNSFQFRGRSRVWTDKKKKQTKGPFSVGSFLLAFLESDRSDCLPIDWPKGVMRDPGREKVKSWKNDSNTRLNSSGAGKYQSISKNREQQRSAGSLLTSALRSISVDRPKYARARREREKKGENVRSADSGDGWMKPSPHTIFPWMYSNFRPCPPVIGFAAKSK